MDWKTTPNIQRALKMRIEAYRMKQGAKKLEQEADKILMPMFVIHDEKAIKDPIYGNFNYVPASTTTSLDKDKLKQSLAIHGVATDIITTCFSEATKGGKRSEYIKYAPIKEKKGEI